MRWDTSAYEVTMQAARQPQVSRWETWTTRAHSDRSCGSRRPIPWDLERQRDEEQESRCLRLLREEQTDHSRSRATKGHLPTSPPQYLVTVPICGMCNRGTSEDDEYFRDMVAMHVKAADHPAAKAVIPSIWRSFDRSQAAGLRAGLRSRMQAVARVSPLGLYAGTVMKVDINMVRIHAVAERIARGLFYHHENHPLPADCLFGVMCVTGREMDAQLRGNVFGLAKALSDQETHNFGNGAFRYRFSHVEESDEAPNSTVWVLSFYEAVDFIALTLDTELEAASFGGGSAA